MRNTIEPSPLNKARISTDADHLPANAQSIHWIVVTRYFVPDWHKGTREEHIAWLKRRGDLFTKYCLPGVLGQPELRKWLLFIDFEYKDYLPDQLSRPIAEGVVSLVDAKSNAEIFEKLKQELSAYQARTTENEHILCTRVDNDDALSRDYFASCAALIQKNKSDIDDHILSFVHGAQFEVDSEKIYSYMRSNNHFTSSVHSKKSNFKRNCFSFNHSKIFENDKILSISTTLPMWLEVIHDENVHNSRPARNFQIPSSLLKSFIPNLAKNEPPIERSYREWQGIFSSAIQESGAMKPVDFVDCYASVCSRVNPKNVFEIGIHEGNSIRMWNSVLGKDARISCMDIGEKSCKCAAPFTPNVYLGSQTDVELLRKIAEENGPFDLVIDDGSHQNDHLKITLQHLFRHVRPGGAYIIEDIFTSYWPNYKGGYRDSDSIIEYIKNALDGVFADYSTQKYKRQFGNKTIPDIPSDPIMDSTEEISVFRSGLAVIYRRAN